MADEQPIIIVKKKGGHAGHHGGAWKVAYSDFITSMMCFFLVMWLVTTASGSTKKGIADYFKDPGIFDKTQHGSPLELGASGLLPDEGYQPKAKTGDTFSKTQNKINKDKADDNSFINGNYAKKSKRKKKIKDENLDDIDISKLTANKQLQVLNDIKEKIKEDIEEKLKQNILNDNPAIMATQKLKDFLGDVEITVDGSAINIDIIDTEKVSMFPLGSSEMNKKSKDALYAIAQTLKDLPNEFEIVGHTDAVPYSGKTNYSNWELSSERANAARRILEDAGVEPNKIVSVQGRADRELKVQDDPFSPKNRRITLRMNFSQNELLDMAKEHDKSKINAFERINMRINEEKVKSITTAVDNEEETTTTSSSSVSAPSISQEQQRELNREEAMEEIIKRNSKKTSLNTTNKNFHHAYDDRAPSLIF